MPAVTRLAGTSGLIRSVGRTSENVEIIQGDPVIGTVCK